MASTAGAGVTAFALLITCAAGGAAQAKPMAAKPVTIAFSDARSVPSVSSLQTELGYFATAACAGKPVKGIRTVKQAIADAIKVEDRAGSKAVTAVDAGRDKKPALALFAQADKLGGRQVRHRHGGRESRAVAGPGVCRRRAGAYITVHGDTVTDAGVTVSASAER